jgi:hypothetical protein
MVRTSRPHFDPITLYRSSRLSVAALSQRSVRNKAARSEQCEDGLKDYGRTCPGLKGGHHCFFGIEGGAGIAIGTDFSAWAST